MCPETTDLIKEGIMTRLTVHVLTQPCFLETTDLIKEGIMTGGVWESLAHLLDGETTDLIKEGIMTGCCLGQNLKFTDEKQQT